MKEFKYSSDEICHEITSELPSVDFRPRAHHLLFKRDDQFDSRLNAFNKCNDFLKKTYEITLKQLSSKLIDKLINAFLSAVDAIEYEHSVPFNLISSSLSDYDNNEVIFLTVTQLEDKLNVLVAETDCHNCSSAHELFVNIVDNLRQNLAKRVVRQRYRGAKDKLAAKHNEVLDLIKYAPLTALNSLLHQYKHLNYNTKSIVFVLKHAEKVPLTIFADVIESLHEITDLNIHLFVFCSSLCSLPLLLDKAPRSLIAVTISSTVLPFDIFDKFMGKVFASCELPISFPPMIIEWLHEKFWRCKTCVKTTMDR